MTFENPFWAKYYDIAKTMNKYESSILLFPIVLRIMQSLDFIPGNHKPKLIQTLYGRIIQSIQENSNNVRRENIQVKTNNKYPRNLAFGDSN